MVTLSTELLRMAPKLETLILRDNRLKSLPKLGGCPNLWNIDLSNNKLKTLDGFDRFSMMGQIDLSGNLVTWPELFKLKHMQVHPHRPDTHAPRAHAPALMSLT